MYIKRVILHNIRSYKDIDIELSKGINLIVGANNSGKSTLLKAIKKLQPSYTPINVDDIRKTKLEGLIDITLDGIEEFEMDMFKVQEPQIVPYSNQTRVFFSFNGLKRNEQQTFVLPATDLDDLDSKPQTFSFSGFSDQENKRNFIYPFLSNRKSSYNYITGGSAYKVAEDFSNLASKIQHLTNGSNDFHNEFKQHCKDILGFDIGIVGGVEGTNHDKIGIFVKQGESIYLESLGEGVVNILGLLAILLTENNKLFLIEELENDIHPEALKKILALIIQKSKSNQFVISTHSNIVLKYLAATKDCKIYFTDWKIEKNKKDNAKLPTTVMTEIQNHPETRLRLLEKLGYDLFDFDLYSSYLIFEESSAEQIVRDYLIPEFVPSLKGKLKTIAANGADNLEPRFADFLRLFVYVHTSPIYKNRAWVLADGDPKGKEIIQKLKDSFKNWPSNSFITFKNHFFEEYYPIQFKKEFYKINVIVNKDERRQQKAELTQKVVKWIECNKVIANKAFAKSAKEVIDILTDIDIFLKK